MTERSPFYQSETDMCPHGNFVATCNICNTYDYGEKDMVLGNAIPGPDGKPNARELITREEAERRAEKNMRTQLENNAHPDSSRIKQKLFMFLDRAHQSDDSPEKLSSLAKELSAVINKGPGERVGPYSGMHSIKGLIDGINDPTFSLRQDIGRGLGMDDKDIINKDSLIKAVEKYLQGILGVEKRTITAGEDRFDETLMEAADIKITPDRGLEGKVAEVWSDAFQYNDKLAGFYREKYLPANNSEQSKLRASAGEAINRGDQSDFQSLNSRADMISKNIQRIGMPTSPEALPIVRPARVVVYKNEQR